MDKLSPFRTIGGKIKRGALIGLGALVIGSGFYGCEPDPVGPDVTDVKVQGMYVDKLGDPINSAQVIMLDNEDKQKKITSTDNIGGFSFTLKSDDYNASALQFSRDNTSDFERSLTLNGKDQNLGEIKGNIGPEKLGTIPDQTMTNGGNITLNLDDYFHNDETGQYIARNDSFNITNSNLSFTTDIAGNYSSWIVAIDRNDAALKDSLELKVNVSAEPNQAPVVSDFSPVSFNEDEAYTGLDLNEKVTDDHTTDANMSWTYAGNTNVQVSIDPVTKILSLSTPENWYGAETITLTATDEGGLTHSKPLEILVNSVNDLPVIGDLPDATINQGESNSNTKLDEYISDVETADENIVWTYAGNSHVTVSVNQSRDVTFTAPTNWYGVETITFTAKDANNASVSDAVNITVPEPGNSAPVVSDIPNANFNEDAGPVIGPDLDNYVTDDKTTDANMKWTFAGNTNISVSIDPATHVVTYTSPANWYGVENITFTAEDEGGLKNSDLVVGTVNSINDLPVMQDLPSRTMDEDNSDTGLDLDNYISDVETPDANISWNYSGNSNISVGIDANKVVTFTPSANWFGTENITFIGTDADGGQASKTLEARVNSVNDPVSVSNIPNVSYNEGGSNNSTDLDGYVTDVETSDANMTWTYAGNTNVNVSVNPSSHVVTFSSPAGWYGVETITFTADDNNGSTDSDNVIVTVNQAANQAPVVGNIPDVNFNEDTGPITGPDLDDYVTDDNTSDANIAWTYAGNTNVSVSINPTTHIVTYDTPADWFGSETITFTASDEGNLTDSDNVGAIVSNVNDAPTHIQSISNLVTPQNQAVDIYLPTHFADVDNAINQMLVEVLNLANATSQIIGGETLRITPNSEYNGNIENLIVQITDPGSLSAQSNAFGLEVQGVPMSLVTFTLKSVYEDAILNSGLSTVTWNKVNNPWPSDSVRTANNGIIQVQLEQGVAYEVNGLHENSIDAIAGITYTFFRGDVHEQRARDDVSSPLTFNTENPNVTIYKPMSDFPIFWMSEYASKLDGVNIGIRRFGDNALNAIAWWDGNYEASNANVREWIQDIINDLATIPHVGLNFTFQEGTTQPSQPHVRMAVDASFPLGINSTNYTSSTHEITQGIARYSPWPNEYTFKIEFIQAKSDLEDFSGQDPAILNGSAQNYTLNLTGRKIMSLMYLADPKTKF